MRIWWSTPPNNCCASACSVCARATKTQRSRSSAPGPNVTDGIGKRGKSACSNAGLQSDLVPLRDRADRGVVDLASECRRSVHRFVCPTAGRVDPGLRRHRRSRAWQSEGRHFSGYYDNYCFLPLYVFCGEQLLVAYLRPAKQDAALHAAAILKLLTRACARRGPACVSYSAAIGVLSPIGCCRGASATASDYIVGLARIRGCSNGGDLARAGAGCVERRQPQRIFGEFAYQAPAVASGPAGDRQGRAQRARRQPALHRHQPAGNAASALRADLLRPRRDGEPHQGMPARPVRRPHQLPSVVAQPVPPVARQPGLRVDGATAHRRTWPAPSWPRAQVRTLRCRLLKIGAVIVRNTRRIRFFLASAFPYSKASSWSRAASPLDSPSRVLPRHVDKQRG